VVSSKILQIEKFADFSPVSVFFLAETLSRNWNESDRLFVAFWTLTVSPPDFFLRFED